MITFKKYSVRYLLSLLALTFSVSILALSPIHCEAQPAIFAGEGMGQIQIGETRASVHKKLGKPTKSLRWESVSILQDTWTSNKSKSRLVVLYPANNPRVAQVETTSPKFYTPEGLSIQANPSEALAFLGSGDSGLLLKRVESPKPQYYMMMYHAKKGIAFFFNMTPKDLSRGKCEKIMVFSHKMPFFSPNTYKIVSSGEFMRNRGKRWKG